MRLQLEPLGTLRLGPGLRSTQTRPFEGPGSAPDATKREIRPDLPVDPFDAAEGRFHHRCPAKLSQRIAELEREDARKANIVAAQADEIARLNAVVDQLCGSLLDTLPLAYARAGAKERLITKPQGSTNACCSYERFSNHHKDELTLVERRCATGAHHWSGPDDGTPRCLVCGLLVGRA